MASTSTTNLQEAIHGIIVRSSATPSRRHAYLSIPADFPATFPNTVIVTPNSITAAPHFPNITILDAIPSNILYQTSNTLPDFFHVYNYISGAHFHISFPFHHDYSNAAIVKLERNNKNYFEVIVACVEYMKVLFCIYSSQRKSWSEIPFDLTPNEILLSRRKPIHVEEGVVFFDLIERFLIRFDSVKKHVQHFPKHVSSLEVESGRHDEEGLYGECEGFLHCVKINPVERIIEIWRMGEGVWGLVGIGKEKTWKGKKILGFHPNVGTLVIMKYEGMYQIYMDDCKGSLEWECSVEGRNGGSEEGSGGRKKLRLFDNDISVPSESGAGVVEEEEKDGEILIFWLYGNKLDLK